MTYYITYNIKDIDGQFVMPIELNDSVKSVTSLIKKEFAIIPSISAKIYGSELQSTNIISECIQGQDCITFEVKNIDGYKSKIEHYRQLIITPRYQSNTTFIVFSTFNFHSMTTGDKIHIDINEDGIPTIQEKIKNMILLNYKSNIDANKILLFLPGGVPFLIGNISNYVKYFKDYMPHLYAIIITNNSITDSILDEKFEIICNLNNPKIKALISPDCDREINGLCQMAAILGYIQYNSQNVSRMIYSIAKFCPFAPLICGLYSLSYFNNANGRTILQITAPLITLFKEMNKNIKIEQTKLFSYAVKFLTYFMNINISQNVPCTKFVRNFYNTGYEKYFHDNFENGEYSKIENFVAFDPDFRDYDWIRFQLPSLIENDFQNAMNHTKSLEIIPTMSLREMHRNCLFEGIKGPMLFLPSFMLKTEKNYDLVIYIDPINGIIEQETYESIAIKVSEAKCQRYDTKSKYFNKPRNFELKRSCFEECQGPVMHIPAQFLCPLTGKIMNEPVKTSSGVFFEKVALKKYLLFAQNPTCNITGIPLNKNMKLNIDYKMKAKIEKWKKDYSYIDYDEEEDEEERDIIYCIKNGMRIKKPIYNNESINIISKKNSDINTIQYENDNQEFKYDQNMSSNHPPPRIRPFLTD